MIAAVTRSTVPVRALAWLLAACALLGSQAVRADTWFLTVAGLGGEPDYEQRFRTLAADLDRTFRSAGATSHVTTLSGPDATRAQLAKALRAIADQAKAEDDFVLILVGHGSFDGQQYKFNLVGPDISAAELAQLCNRVPSRRQLIVNTTSSSGASVAALARRNRAVITATKSGTEKNATVFARYWLEALQDPTADVNKNESISALEAFQFADRKTAAFYESEKRLATEHAVIEDTGKKEAVRTTSAENGEGLLATNFILLRLGAAQKAANDPAKRALLDKKEELERKIDLLKYQKAAMTNDDYKKQLSDALLELARVQGDLDK